MLYKVSKKNILAGPDKGKVKHSVSFSHENKISFEEVINQVKMYYSINPGDLYRVVYALSSVIRNNLAQGNIVEIEKLGNFSLGIQTAEWKEDRSFTRRDIRGIKVNFHPAKNMKIQKEGLRFAEKRDIHKNADNSFPQGINQ